MRRSATSPLFKLSIGVADRHPHRLQYTQSPNPMAFAIYVTETVVSSYEFETEAEAREALECGDFWHLEAEVVDGEVTDTEIVELG